MTFRQNNGLKKHTTTLGVEWAFPLNEESSSLQQLCQIRHDQIQHQDRKDILLAVRNILATQKELADDFEVEKLVSLARYLCDWPTLIYLIDNDIWHPKANELYLADAQMGRFDLALIRVERALQSQPYDLDLVTAKQQLNLLNEAQPYAFDALNSGHISLTPLSFNHVADFSWQYSNSGIAELCNLPVFPTAHHWMHWLQQCQQEKERRLFAIMHEEYGFVGSVSLQVYDGLGFFYYWLGTDFQGQGLGPKAVSILMHLGMKYMDMECCYAKVFAHNKPSHKAIAKLGFKRLSFKAHSPSDDEVFYYSGTQKSAQQHFSKLSWLLQVLNSEVRLKEFETDATS